jgi:glucans biosynthesis protein C
MHRAVATNERRYDLDWLRVIAIVLLLYFHTAMIFAAELDWHIRSEETSHALLEFNFFLSRWRMALLFLISGIGTGFALGSRTAGPYLRERFTRLVVPVVFGMLVIVPPQIYFERLADGAGFASYLHFWPSVLELRPYPEGNMSWHHLWFVVYLFLYSVAALPLFLYLRSEAGRPLRERIARWLRRASLYVLALPLGFVMAALLPIFPGPQDVVSDWAHLAYYFLFFVYGYVLYGVPELWSEVERRRRTSLGLAILCILVINVLRWNDADPALGYSLASAGYRGLHAMNSLCWVLAILGYGRRHLNVRNRFLDYANEGIYPFYILHQTVIVMVGYYAVQVRDDAMTMFWFVSTVSLILTVAAYEFLVRPYPVTRFLFGMKPRPAPALGFAAPAPAVSVPVLGLSAEEADATAGVGSGGAPLARISGTHPGRHP